MSELTAFNIDKILRWDKWHTSLLLFAGIISFLLHNLTYVGIVSTLSFCVYFYYFRVELNQYSPFSGYANLVTLFRTLLLIAAIFYWKELSQNTLLFIFLVVVCLDWLDGFIAKKLSIKSDFGLYLDMETDALLVATMSFILWEKSNLHWIILIAGFLRYAYSFILVFINNGGLKEPKRAYASVIAGLFYVALLLNFAVTSEIAVYFLYLTSSAIILSFGRSFHYQLLGSRK